MSTDDSSQKQSRYEKLSRPKLKIDRSSNSNPYKIKPSALSYQITDSLNKLAQPKRRPDLNLYDYPTTSARAGSISGSHGDRPLRHKLINSSEESRNIVDSGKRKNLLDSYARITATRNRRCPKRLRELARPNNNNNKRNSIDNEDTYGNYSKPLYHTFKNYETRTDTTFGSHNRR